MVNARLGEKARLTYPRLQSVSRCLYTGFSGPYKAFSISILTVFPQTDRYENYTNIWKRIEVWHNAFLRAIDISMEMKNKKMKIGETFIRIQREPDCLKLWRKASRIHKNKIILYVWSRVNRKYISNHSFWDIEHEMNRQLSTVLKICYETIIVWLVFFFTISKPRLFLKVTPMILG